MSQSTVLITALSHEGWGVAKSDEGRTLFIQGALPGETVTYQPTERKKDYIKGVCLEVIADPHHQRVVPPCIHSRVCGGCSFQHLASDAQLGFKQQSLADQLAHADIAVGQWCAPLQAQTQYYRHKARLSVRYVRKKGGVLVGFRERLNGRFLADIDSCQVMAEPVASLVRPLRDLLGRLEIADAIAQVEVAITDSKTALVLRHLAPIADDDRQRLLNFAELNQICWYSQAGGVNTIRPLDPTQSPWLQYQLEGLSFEFLPQDFTQIHPQLNQLMVRQAINWMVLDADEMVLDLFCGLGNFSLPVAKYVKQVVGVEGCEAMVQRARHNASRNQLKNTAFHATDLFDQFDRTAVWLKRGYDKLLLDPPRAGAKLVCERIDDLGVSGVLYVSCAVSSFVRDARILTQRGFSLKKIGVMDMFPHTGHIETMAWFTKEPNGKGQRRSSS